MTQKLSTIHQKLTSGPSIHNTPHTPLYLAGCKYSEPILLLGITVLPLLSAGLQPTRPHTPFCKDALRSIKPSLRNIKKGFAWLILYLLGPWGVSVWWERRFVQGESSFEGLGAFASLCVTKLFTSVCASVCSAINIVGWSCLPVWSQTPLSENPPVLTVRGEVIVSWWVCYDSVWFSAYRLSPTYNMDKTQVNSNSL